MTLNIEGIEVSRSFHYPAFLEELEKTAEKESLEAEESKLILNNLSIMKRSEERMELIPELKKLLRKEELSPRAWLVISDPLCPDSARNLPFIRAVAERSFLIDLQIVLKEEHPELMERFQTEGKRAVPKLLELNPEEKKVIDTWGPRPTPIQDQVKTWKENEPELSKEELHRRIQKWYAKDRGRTIQEELLAMLKRGTL